MALGKTIKAIREAKGLSQEALSRLTGWSEDAPQIGVSQGAISAIEKRDSTSSKHTPALAQALNIPVTDLISGAIPTILKIEQASPKHGIRDSILDDLDALPPEEAASWRAQIRSAAASAKRASPPPAIFEVSPEDAAMLELIHSADQSTLKALRLLLNNSAQKHSSKRKKAA